MQNKNKNPFTSGIYTQLNHNLVPFESQFWTRTNGRFVFLDGNNFNQQETLHNLEPLTKKEGLEGLDKQKGISQEDIDQGMQIIDKALQSVKGGNPRLSKKLEELKNKMDCNDLVVISKELVGLAIQLRSRLTIQEEKGLKENKELAEYFGIPEADLSKVEQSLNQLNFSLVSILGPYKKFIESELESNAKTDSAKRLIANIKAIIGFRIKDLPGEIERQKQGNGGSLENMQWIINGKITERFNKDVSDTLFSYAIFYTKMQNGEFEGILNKDPALKSKYESTFQSIQKYLVDPEMKNGNVSSLGTLLTIDGENIIDSLGIYDTLNKGSEKHGIKEISMLNEQDRQIEREAMMWYMGSCAYQMAPFAGAFMSIPVDIMDSFSNTEGTIKYLQGLGVVDQRFRMEKSWVDNVFGAVGLTLTAIGAQGFVKSGKLARVMSKVQNISKVDVVEMLRTLGKKMNKNPEEIAKAEEIAKGENIAGEANKGENLLNKPQVNDEVIKTVKLETKNIRNARIIERNLPEGGVQRLIEISEINPGAKIGDLKQELTNLALEHGLPIEFSKDLLRGPQGRIINEIISNNHPMIAVSKIKSGDTVGNVNIAGQKGINDKLGQAFTDEVLVIFRGILTENFDRYYEVAEQGAKGKIIRALDYKNFTVAMPAGSLPKDDLVGILFGQFKNKQGVKEEIIKQLRESGAIERVAKEKKLTNDQVEKLIMNNFDFGVGKCESKPPKDGQTQENAALQAFYGAENSSRKGRREDGIETHVFNIDNVRHHANEAIRIGNEIVSKYTGKTFTYHGVEYPVTLPDGKINKTLLRVTRKGKEIEPKELEGLAKQYIDHLNDGFDFIAPTIKKDYGKEVKQMSDDLNKGVINPETLLRNFKGTYTKEALQAMSEGKPGMRIFVDVKDMGLLNLDSFRALGERIGKSDFSPEELLQAGGEVTEQFIKTVSIIQGKYPNARISLGGDEVFIFIEGAKEFEAKLILKDINEALQGGGLEGRITHSFEGQKLAKDVFGSLDKSTVINKVVEEKLGEEIAKNPSLTGDITQLPNTSVKIDNSIVQNDEQFKILTNEDLLQAGISNDFIRRIINIIGDNMSVNDEVIQVTIGGQRFNFNISNNAGQSLEINIAAA